MTRVLLYFVVVLSFLCVHPQTDHFVYAQDFDEADFEEGFGEDKEAETVEEEFVEEDFTEEEFAEEDFAEEDFENSNLEDSQGDEFKEEFSEEDFENADFEDGKDDEFGEDFAEEDLSLEDFDGEAPVEDVVGGEEELLEPLSEIEQQQVVEEPIPKEEISEELLEPALEAEQPETEEFLAQPEPEPEPEPVQTFEDRPNLEYEAQLYNIYVNYHSEKTSEEQWQSLMGGREGEIYQIQRGDSLWAISETLFGDGNYWPKVWSLNGGITNPHLIKEGNSIGFILGDEGDAPAFTITETPEAPAEGVDMTEEAANGTQAAVSDLPANEEGGKEEEEEELAIVTQGEIITIGGEEIELPPPSIVSKPVVRNLPPSLPMWHTQAVGDTFDEMGMEFVKRPIAEIEDRFPLLGYLSEKPPAGLGKVTEVEGGNRVATVNQYIYVRGERGTIKEGEEYGVVFNRGRIEQSHDSIEVEFPAYNIEVQGEIKIQQKMETDGREDFEVFRALVTGAINPILVGGILVDEKMSTIRLDENGPKNDIVSQVIGGVFTNRSKLFGPQTLMFINRGEADGVEVGQVLGVRANRKVRNPNSNVVQNVQPVGWVQVVKTTKNFATAFVLKAWDEMVAGDLTGRGLLTDIQGSLEGRESELMDEVEDDLDFDSESDLNDDDGFGGFGPDTAEAELIEGDDDGEFGSFEEEEVEEGFFEGEGEEEFEDTSDEIL